MPSIVLATLNARYLHASLGLRYLFANLGELQSQASIAEFVLGTRPLDVVEALLKEEPRIVGFGVYIWNVDDTSRIIAMLKEVAPEVVVVAGGPEVSYEVGEQRICALADYVITGPGDATFAKLCAQVLSARRPAARILAGEQVPLSSLALPYSLYSDADIASRFLYVEASRGCPFKCEFCLSSLDRTAWPFDLERFLAEMQSLFERGARHFRFVDRTFNLNVSASRRILEFFLDRMDERLFVHFELIPDHLPDGLREAIARFPAGSLHLEIGIQTFNPQVQALISRKQDNAKAQQNFVWLREHSTALIHADLIAGLPGEDLASFGQGFDRLHAMRPHEIQVGILKRLRGTPIARHTEAFRMRYNPDPPYNVLATDRIGFADMQRITRFSRYWEMVGNAGRFRRTLPVLLGGSSADAAGAGTSAVSPFGQFMRFSDWLFATIRKTHEIALERLFDAVLRYLVEERGIARESASELVLADYESSGAKGRLSFMKTGTGAGRAKFRGPAAERRARVRQARHHDR
ncbi:MAG: B12-binding domain-containing radical SAM protein [Betaproteobacteria bacterium RIFCSPLOWO2_12_FULL_63_13]|nr:MAG: B12-binding domain-containing radical SAM protein [Betaproteobacteria bacterium RIFCSPLOWO2_12_FULL_63_13]